MKMDHVLLVFNPILQLFDLFLLLLSEFSHLLYKEALFGCLLGVNVCALLCEFLKIEDILDA